jgi:hypothetical protein
VAGTSLITCIARESNEDASSFHATASRTSTRSQAQATSLGPSHVESTLLVHLQEAPRRGTCSTMDYVSYLHQRLLIEEQLRRDLVAQEWLTRTRQVGNVNTGNVGVYEATNAFANSRIDPLVSRNSYPGSRHPLLSGIPPEPAKKKQKAKVATLPRFTSKEGVAHSFLLGFPACRAFRSSGTVSMRTRNTSVTVAKSC